MSTVEQMPAITQRMLKGVSVARPEAAEPGGRYQFEARPSHCGSQPLDVAGRRAVSGTQQQEREFMVEFLVEIPHEERNCLELIRQLRAQGDLTKLTWGCESGVHTGWGVITASNEAEACLVVPPLARPKARVVRVARFDAAIIVPVHKMEPALPNPSWLQMYRAFPCWW